MKIVSIKDIECLPEYSGNAIFRKCLREEPIAHCFLKNVSYFDLHAWACLSKLFARVFKRNLREELYEDYHRYWQVRQENYVFRIHTTNEGGEEKKTKYTRMYYKGKEFWVKKQEKGEAGGFVCTLTTVINTKEDDDYIMPFLPCAKPYLIRKVFSRLKKCSYATKMTVIWFPLHLYTIEVDCGLYRLQYDQRNNGESLYLEETNDFGYGNLKKFLPTISILFSKFCVPYDLLLRFIPS